MTEALKRLVAAQRARFFAVALTPESEIELRIALAEARFLGCTEEQIFDAIREAAQPAPKTRRRR